MRIEIIIFIITSLLIANLYTDGKYVNTLFKYKKYYQMAGIGLGGLVVYYVIKKNPLSAGSMITTTNEYLKYMPIDKNTTSFVKPILDFTASQCETNSRIPIYEKKIMTSGENNTNHKVKRSVSETKKKFVASRQGWKCGDCQDQLNAWFEVDHKMRLEHGGSNHVDNLVALCRDCHGKKTTIENL
jgi:transposase-like protein